ncbi:MAG: VWA domain-containing protein [Pseudomonadota bacterium]
MSVSLAPAWTKTSTENIIFIFDASNSMWGQVEGKTKFQIAKTAVEDTIDSLPVGTGVGLVAYGHQHSFRLQRCDDIEVLSNIVSKSDSDISIKLGRIRPNGQTPISAALIRTFEWLQTSQNQSTDWVLISDGLESCEGNPCEVAAGLSQKNVDLKVHVIGYALENETDDSLKCIAEETGGTFSNAGNSDDLIVALAAVSQEITEPELETTLIEKSFFEDDFEDSRLKPDWVIRNAKPPDFILEDSSLLVVSGQNQAFKDSDPTNLFTLGLELPKNDWDISIEARFQLSSGRDLFEFGLLNDPENYFSVQFWSNLGDWCKEISYGLLKRSGGQDTTAYQKISASSSVCGAPLNPDTDLIINSIFEDGVKIGLSKRGREYRSTLILSGYPNSENPLSFETEPLSMLNPPKTFAMQIGTYQDTDGEIAAYFDRIEITGLSSE